MRLEELVDNDVIGNKRLVPYYLMDFTLDWLVM